MKEFKNEKFINFSDKAYAKKQQKALAAVRSSFGREYPNFIGGQEVYSDAKTTSINPGQINEIVGIFQKSGKDHAEQAMQAALKAFESWKNVPFKERANFLFKAAKVIRKRRLEINAWMISEVGKNYAEADGDTCEAIDFLEYYGRETLRYGGKQPITKLSGEKNRLTYIPLGVGVVIPPWNFPFAILVGMTSAAIACGNTVVLKPSSESPMMGWLFADIMRSIGLPDGVLNYVVASGAEAGDYLVQHPKTRFISFTGSMEVGLRINELAAKKTEGQIWIKRVVAEMGGKDSIIVDKVADVDEAVKGTVSAAFGFQGQKCSACSRVIVHADIYDKFCDALSENVKTVKVDNAVNNPPMGPVINKRSQDNVLRYINKAVEEGGTIIAGGNKIEGKGYFVEPTIIKDVERNATISQEEIFGPVLAVLKANDFDDAISIANNTMFGLTGAIYTKNKKRLHKGAKEFFAGNLYLNRKCTGALVGVHPFGGFNMSGTDSKAGGRDYLGLFMQAKLTSEKKIKK